MSESGDGSAAILGRMTSAARGEAREAAARLDAVADLMALRMVQDGGASDKWVFDVVDAVAVEIAATMRISRGLAASHIRYADALRNQLPRVGQAFRVGDIDEATFRAVVFRTGLITDPDTLATVDGRLAARMPRWGVMTPSQLAARIDKIVARVDLDAVRRRKERLAEREVFVGDVGDGLAEISATVFATDGHAVADRLTALAATVCDDDPRTLAQRRADAFGALAADADRLSCRCGNADCPAGGKAASAVVIHVIAEQATVDGTGDTPGMLSGYEGLIPPEMIAQLAGSARLRPLIHPGGAPPECGYSPSRALADFVRCRDVTCRAPGCDRPAVGCDLDHTIAYGEGGLTCAWNLKCLCRFHHLLKTFWGWHDQQLADGTIIWTAPNGEKHVTHPGGAIVFPGLRIPTEPTATTVTTPEDRCGDKTAMMPRKERTRAQNRSAAIDAERRANHQHRTNPQPVHRYDEHLDYEDTFTTTNDPDPPPF